MKNLFRQVVGFITVGPVVLMVYLFSVLIGRERAVRLWGPSLTTMAKIMLRFFIPNIRDASEFHMFPEKMKKSFPLWRPFYDFHVEQESGDIFKLHVTNCPFCEAIIAFGVPELAPYVCRGDWEIAKENANKWDFARTHEIGKGDSFCDHTYLRKR